MPSPPRRQTSAVKLNRRPPLTTLATRLMVTTRSRFFRDDGLRATTAIYDGPGLNDSDSTYSLQKSRPASRAPSATRRPAVVAVAAAVEHHRGHPLPRTPPTALPTVCGPCGLVAVDGTRTSASMVDAEARVLRTFVVDRRCAGVDRKTTTGRAVVPVTFLRTRGGGGRKTAGVDPTLR